MPLKPHRFFGVQRSPSASVRTPGERYVLNGHQLADWSSGDVAREEIRATCRRWLEADPATRFVEISDGHRVIERVERGACER